ncbi:MAG: hypothetical protein GX911_01485 [Spirochaetales bacterium]|nr:hypothetical protein [Spirochaetales bacterium]
MEENDFSGERQVFDTAYELMIHHLEWRARTTSLSIHDLEGELYHLTIYEGQDWGGRGSLKAAEIEGRIQAYITMINRMKKERDREKPHQVE